MIGLERQYSGNSGGLHKANSGFRHIWSRAISGVILYAEHVGIAKQIDMVPYHAHKYKQITMNKTSCSYRNNAYYEERKNSVTISSKHVSCIN